MSREPAVHDDMPDRFPEVSVATRCQTYGHVLGEHDLLGRVCLRCGLFDPEWCPLPDGSWRSAAALLQDGTNK